MPDAVSNILATQTSDPGGFTLMVICISLLVILAASLMVVTLTYKKKKNGTKS
jgi:Sec-independent protein secretion pathway component TatC